MELIENLQGLVIIDSRISDWQALSAQFSENHAILIMNESIDGLIQVSDYLRVLSDEILFQGIQILLHGSMAELVDLSSGHEGDYVIITETSDGATYSSHSASASLSVNVNNDPPDSLTADIAPTYFEGMVLVAVAEGDDHAESLSMQSDDDKITVAEFSHSEVASGNVVVPTDIDSSVVRLNADSALDINFLPAESTINNSPSYEVDNLYSTSGDDVFDGQAETDKVIYLSAPSNYQLQETTSSYAINSQSEDADTLTDVERLQLADSSLVFDWEGHAGQVYRLYQAAFNRTPDQAGLGGWISAMDSGMALEQVATGFIGSAEFQDMYGANPAYGEFVNLLYHNVLQRAPDKAGFDVWVNLLATHVLTPEDVLIGFSESAENKNALLSAIQESIAFTWPHQFTGSEVGDIIIGTGSADTLLGLAGNDILIGLTGDDTIDGGADIDAAVYFFSRSTYTITQTDSSLIVVDNSGLEGTDTLTNIERLQFADANLAFDLAGNAGQIYRLYQAAFNRTPDQPGLGYWIHSMDNGMTLQQVATGFMGSAEFQSLYGANPTNGELINLLYGNVLHRTADQAGYDAWMYALDSGAISLEGVLIGFSESNENKIFLTGVTENGIEYQAWL